MDAERHERCGDGLKATRRRMPASRLPIRRTIRIPGHLIETINKLIRTSRALVQELGREPTSEEIAQRMDIPVSKVRKVRHREALADLLERLKPFLEGR